MDNPRRRMAATAILFGIYPLMLAPMAMGVCSVL